MTSFYETYCPSCAQCNGPLDWPGANIPVKAWVKAKPGSTKVLIETEVRLMCRKCIVEALVAIDTPLEERPNAGWLYRLIRDGKLEPSGIPKKES